MSEQFNREEWTYVWWNEIDRRRHFKGFKTPGDALACAFDDLKSEGAPYLPIEIWHKGWIMYNDKAIMALYQKELDNGS